MPIIPLSTKGQSIPSLKENFPEVALEDLAGCAQYQGPAVSLEEMAGAIVRGSVRFDDRSQ
jgi:uncharacterized protein (DUF433 family)